MHICYIQTFNLPTSNANCTGVNNLYKCHLRCVQVYCYDKFLEMRLLVQRINAFVILKGTSKLPFRGAVLLI